MKLANKNMTVSKNINVIYTETDRPVGFGACYDCRLPYKSFPCDMNVTDEVWKQISPTKRDGGGLLCPMCICERLMTLDGATYVKAEVGK